MNCTIKEATVKRFHYDSHDQLRTHLADFMAAYNFARRLQDAQRTHTLRIHRQDLDVRARPVHRRLDPPDAGTEHLRAVLIKGAAANSRDLLEETGGDPRRRIVRIDQHR